jgi:hypothetical protein
MIASRFLPRRAPSSRTRPQRMPRDRRRVEPRRSRGALHDPRNAPIAQGLRLHAPEPVHPPEHGSRCYPETTIAKEGSQRQPCRNLL